MLKYTRLFLLALTLGTPGLAQELLLGTSAGTIARTHPVTGQTTSTLSCSSPVAAMTLDGADLLVGDSSGNIFRHDIEKQQETWLFNVPAACGGMSVYRGQLFVSDTAGSVVRVNLQTGRIIEIMTLPFGMDGGPLVIHDGNIFVGSLMGFVVMKSLSDTIDFQFWGTCAGPVSSMTDGGTHLIMGSPSGTLTLVDFVTQSANFHWGASGDTSGLAIHQGDIMTADSDGRLQRVDFSSARVHQQHFSGISVTTALMTPAAEPGFTYCYGISCPCGNDDPSAGCANSLGVGGILRATGSSSVTSDDMVLFVTNVPSNRFGLLCMANDPSSGSLFGDGRLCSGGAGGYRRFPTQTSGQLGFFGQAGIVDFAQQNFGSSGQVFSGSTWTFQMWYRDDQGTCGTGFNLTNGYVVTFKP
jgi:hypothetical protein